MSRALTIRNPLPFSALCRIERVGPGGLITGATEAWVQPDQEIKHPSVPDGYRVRVIFEGPGPAR